MISELILGLACPFLLFYNNIQSAYQSIYHSLYQLVIPSTTLILFNMKTTYDTIIKKPLYIRLCLPIILSLSIFASLIELVSDYIKYRNTNITTYPNKNIVNYTLHGEEYYIILSNKIKAYHQIIKATGYINNDEFDYLNNSDTDTSNTNTDINKNNTDIDENNTDIDENNTDTNIKNDQSDDETDDESNDDVYKTDITKYIKKLYGPHNNFHNSDYITPDILGYDYINIEYIDADEFEVKVKKFSKYQLLRL